MIVLDSSVYIAYIARDETSRYADSAMTPVVSNNVKAIIPSIFMEETFNVLLIMLRSKRIDKKTFQEYFDAILRFPFQIDSYGLPENRLSLAQKYDLTFYDAGYLELAIRKSIPLASLDKQLIKAAKKEKLYYS